MKWYIKVADYGFSYAQYLQVSCIRMDKGIKNYDCSGGVS